MRLETKHPKKILVFLASWLLFRFLVWPLFVRFVYPIMIDIEGENTFYNALSTYLFWFSCGFLLFYVIGAIYYDHWSQKYQGEQNRNKVLTVLMHLLFFYFYFAHISNATSDFRVAAYEVGMDDINQYSGLVLTYLSIGLFVIIAFIIKDPDMDKEEDALRSSGIPEGQVADEKGHAVFPWRKKPKSGKLPQTIQNGKVMELSIPATPGAKVSNKIISTSSDYQWVIVERNNEYYITHTVGSNVDFVRTPLGRMLRTSNVILAQRMLKDLEKDGLISKSSGSALQWHFTAIDSFIGKTPDDLSQMFNRDFLEKSDWTFLINQNKAEWIQLFGAEYERKKAIKLWIDRSNVPQMVAACNIGIKYHSLNVAYIIASISDKSGKALREQEYKQLADYIGESFPGVTTEELSRDFRLFEFYYGLRPENDKASEELIPVSQVHTPRQDETITENLFFSLDSRVKLDENHVGLCLKEYMELRSEYGGKILVFEHTPTFTLVDELFQAGHYVLLNNLYNVSAHEIYKDKPYEFYYFILQFAFEFGVLFADEWHKSSNRLSNEYIEKMFRETPLEASKPLLKEFGMKDENETYKYFQLVLTKWKELCIDLNDAKDKREVKMYSGIFALYILGSTLMLMKRGY